MGVDCKIRLPGNVRVDNVALVVGVLAGCPPRKQKWDGGWAADVPGATVQMTTISGLARVVIEPKTIDGVENHHCYYHFEPSGVENERLLNPQSTAFWIAVGRRLVDFFGGVVDHQDCDDRDVDYAVPFKSWRENAPQDDPWWTPFQERIMALAPITEAEWRACDQFAAYKIGE